MSAGVEISGPVEETELSLEQRMAAAEEQESEATTDDFPVPGWGAFTWVRLKVIGHKIQRAQVEKNRKHARNKALMELYVAADTIMAATDGFYEVKGEDEDLVPVETSWHRLGVAVKKLGGDVTPRQAFIRLIGEERVIPFYTEYIEWLNSERGRIREEQKADFRTTT